MAANNEHHMSAGLYQRRQVLQGLLAAAVPFGTISCTAEKNGPLQVGGLPVTCNLTLPVACVAKAMSNRMAPAGTPQFEYEFSKYSGWPEIKESLMAGRIQAAYMLAPLVMGALGRAKRENQLDSNGLSTMLTGEHERLKESAPGVMGALSRFLDHNNDGNVMDDVSGMLGKAFKR